ncbi:MAG: hypothetical protein F6K40_29085 [Okeania sp. SIO3I5]|uniref:hypothetical protein n=1 Tax=Okeania sp. SIO3I5 TaxID=2607805 RepID=UPI0013B66A2D|nr:hypothetical protein [Okeania sp. SIO3I5]NEQ40075.1 hypothetical protein [Okeania sp. SIO3I5]
MKEISNSNDVVVYRTTNIVNEFKLAKDIRKIFSDTNSSLYKVTQGITKSALFLLRDLNDIISTDPKAVKIKEACVAVYKKEHPLKIWGKEGAEFQENDIIKDVVKPTINKLLTDTLSIQDCGEIIRLFAGICEAVYKDPAKPNTNLTKGFGLKIVTPEKDFLIDFGEFCGLRAAYRATEWGITAYGEENRKREYTGVAIDLKNDTVKQIADVLGLKENEKTGISINKLLPGSVVRGIDKIFALPEGADISGTTADSIWAIETLSNLLYIGFSLNQNSFDKMKEKKPFEKTEEVLNSLQSMVNKKFVGVYNFNQQIKTLLGDKATKQVKDTLQQYATKQNDTNPNVLLLPIAAIVSGYHHTILECALALNTNDYGEYAPGFYTTLQTEAMKSASSGSDIAKILKQYEESSSNRHLIVYEDSEGEKAFQTETPEESDQLKKFIGLKMRLYKYWAGHIGELEKFDKKVIQACMKDSELDMR